MPGFHPHHSFPLQVKLISLADESRTIRRIEHKLKRAQKNWPKLKAERESLRDHRKDDVASSSRATALAYGFLKGKPYKAIEARRFTDPDWKSIERMVKTYAAVGTDLTKQLEAWKAEAGKPDSKAGCACC
jgi:hypothetical protein